jgi:hypothetical protein
MSEEDYADNVDPDLSETDPKDADEGGLVGGGGPAATLEGDEVEPEDDVGERPDSPL